MPFFYSLKDKYHKTKNIIKEKGKNGAKLANKPFFLKKKTKPVVASWGEDSFIVEVTRAEENCPTLSSLSSSTRHNFLPFFVSSTKTHFLSFLFPTDLIRLRTLEFSSQRSILKIFNSNNILDLSSKVSSFHLHSLPIQIPPFWFRRFPRIFVRVL